MLPYLDAALFVNISSVVASPLYEQMKKMNLLHEGKVKKSHGSNLMLRKNYGYKLASISTVFPCQSLPDLRAL